jgi:imidazolonepropionase-like amidohydrolase
MTLVINPGTLIDGNGGEPLANMAVVVENDRIVAVGRRGKVAVPSADVIDAPNATLIPGMIDCHVHIMSSSHRVMDSLATHPTLALFKAARNLTETLRAGFTTVRDAGGGDPGMRQAIELGLVEGPRLLVAAAIGQTGTHMESYFPAGVTLNLSPSAPTRVCDGASEIKRAVRSAFREGFDLIKICTTGGVLSPQDAPDYLEFDLEEIKTVVATAAARNKVVMAHAEGAQGVKNAVLAGVHTVEHASMLDDEGADMLASTNTLLVPTLLLPQWVFDNGRKLGLGDYAMKKAEWLQPIHVASFRKAVAAGIRMAVGTDASGELHGTNAHELTLMVRDGFTPMQAIVAATKHGAEACRLADQVGTVEVGKLADLVLVDGDPLADVSLLERREALSVFKGGRRVGRSS